MDGFAVLAMVTFLAVVTFAVENGYGKVLLLLTAGPCGVLVLIAAFLPFVEARWKRVKIAMRWLLCMLYIIGSTFIDLLWLAFKSGALITGCSIKIAELYVLHPSLQWLRPYLWGWVWRGLDCLDRRLARCADKWSARAGIAVFPSSWREEVEATATEETLKLQDQLEYWMEQADYERGRGERERHEIYVFRESLEGKQQADQRMIEELVEKTKVLNVALSDDSLRAKERKHKKEVSHLNLRIQGLLAIKLQTEGDRDRLHAEHQKLLCELKVARESGAELMPPKLSKQLEKRIKELEREAKGWTSERAILHLKMKDLFNEKEGLKLELHKALQEATRAGETVETLGAKLREFERTAQGAEPRIQELQAALHNAEAQRDGARADVQRLQAKEEVLARQLKDEEAKRQTAETSANTLTAEMNQAAGLQAQIDQLLQNREQLMVEGRQLQAAYNLLYSNFDSELQRRVGEASHHVHQQWQAERQTLLSQANNEKENLVGQAKQAIEAEQLKARQAHEGWEAEKARGNEMTKRIQELEAQLAAKQQATTSINNTGVSLSASSGSYNSPLPSRAPSRASPPALGGGSPVSLPKPAQPSTFAPRNLTLSSATKSNASTARPFSSTQAPIQPLGSLSASAISITAPPQGGLGTRKHLHHFEEGHIVFLHHKAPEDIARACEYLVGKAGVRGPEFALCVASREALRQAALHKTLYRVAQLCDFDTILLQPAGNVGSTVGLPFRLPARLLTRVAPAEVADLTSKGIISGAGAKGSFGSANSSFSQQPFCAGPSTAAYQGNSESRLSTPSSMSSSLSAPASSLLVSPPASNPAAEQFKVNMSVMATSPSCKHIQTVCLDWFGTIQSTRNQYQLDGSVFTRLWASCASKEVFCIVELGENGSAFLSPGSKGTTLGCFVPLSLFMPVTQV